VKLKFHFFDLLCTCYTTNAQHSNTWTLSFIQLFVHSHIHVLRRPQCVIFTEATNASTTLMAATVFHCILPTI